MTLCFCSIVHCTGTTPAMRLAQRRQRAAFDARAGKCSPASFLYSVQSDFLLPSTTWTTAGKCRDRVLQPCSGHQVPEELTPVRVLHPLGEGKPVALPFALIVQPQDRSSLACGRFPSVRLRLFSGRRRYDVNLSLCFSILARFSLSTIDHFLMIQAPVQQTAYVLLSQHPILRPYQYPSKSPFEHG